MTMKALRPQQRQVASKHAPPSHLLLFASHPEEREQVTAMSHLYSVCLF